MAPVIAISNQKGGVGKTTLTYHLAQALAEEGFRVLVLDNDPQANLTLAFLGDAANLPTESKIIRLYQEQPWVPIRSSRVSFVGTTIHLATMADRPFMDVVRTLKAGLEQERTAYDFILIDCLPGLGNLIYAALFAADYLLVPVRPSQFGLLGLNSLLDQVAKVSSVLRAKVKLAGIALNMVDPRHLLLEREMEARLRERYGGRVMKAILHRRIAYEESTRHGKTICRCSNNVATQEFMVFLDEFLELVGYPKKKTA